MRTCFAVQLLMLALLVGCSDESKTPLPTAEETDRPAAPGNSSSDAARLATAMRTREFIQACEATPGCADEAAQDTAATEPVWRIRVVRETTGKIRIAGVETVQLPAGTGAPVGPVYGEVALVARNRAGNVVDGQLLRFPEELRVEFAESPGTERVDLAGTSVDTIAYLRASSDVVEITVEDGEGTVLYRSEPPAAPDTAWLNRLERLLGVSEAHALTRPFSDLPPHCAHVIVLQGEEDRQLFAGGEFEDIARLGWPGPYQLAATRAALARMTPLLCQAVGRIAFAYVDDERFESTLGAVNSFGGGDLVVINVATLLREDRLEEMLNRRLMLQATLVHEAAHAAETLLTVESSSNARVLARNYSGAWGFPARTLAEKTIDNVRLEAGMEAEWKRMHESFVAQDWAKNWGVFDNGEGEPPINPSRSDIARGGFMARYGSSNWAEDIATMVANAYFARVIGEAYEANGVGHLREDWGCLEMRAWTKPNLPSHFAALYTKLHFLLDLGLVTEEGVDYCTGDQLGLDDEGPGFHLWHKGEKRRVYDTALTAKMGQKQSGAPVFEMQAEGSAGFSDDEYETTVKLRLDVGNRFQPFDKISWPRGAYALGLTGDNNFTLRLDGAPAGNFDTMDGFALVAQASHERIAGSIVVQRVFRLNAPLPVPELYDPPLVIRFSIEK